MPAKENKLMMQLVITTEAFFFLCLLVAYLFFWRTAHFNKQALQWLDVKDASMLTVVLVASSISLGVAGYFQKRGKARRMKGFLLATIVLGFLFLAGQAREYAHLLQGQVTIPGSEFGSCFYTLTAFHALHVLVGLLILVVVLALFFRKRLTVGTTPILHTVSIYWHFVDVVWLVIFFVVYLLPHFLS